MRVRVKIAIAAAACATLCVAAATDASAAVMAEMVPRGGDGGLRFNVLGDSGRSKVEVTKRYRPGPVRGDIYAVTNPSGATPGEGCERKSDIRVLCVDPTTKNDPAAYFRLGGGVDRLTIPGMMFSRLMVGGGPGSDFLESSGYSLKEYRIVLDGGLGADRVVGGTGNDFLRGGAGPDTLLGLGNDDRLYGGSGADRMFGDQGFDVLNAADGAADRVIDCGEGDEWGRHRDLALIDKRDPAPLDSCEESGVVHENR